MKREYSLKGTILFQEIFKKGIKLQKKGVQILLLNKKSIGRDTVLSKINDGNIKIGIAISKKIGKAHDRNRLKRRIRAICRDYIPGLNNHYCLIIRPGKNFNVLHYQDQKKILASLLMKSGLLTHDETD